MMRWRSVNGVASGGWRAGLAAAAFAALPLMAAPASANPQLRIVPREMTGQVGEMFNYDLLLISPDLGMQIDSDPRVVPHPDLRDVSDAIDDPFVMGIELTLDLTEPGFETIGPVRLTFGDTQLISNEVVIRVYPAWEPDEVGLKFQLSHEQVEVGQPFVLVVRQRFSPEGKEPDKIGFNWDMSRESDVYDVTQDRHSINRWDRFDSPYHVRREDYIFVVHRPGTFRIDRGMLKHLPEDVELTDLQVEVVEPAAPSGE